MRIRTNLSKLLTAGALIMAVLPVSMQTAQAQASTAQFTTTVIIANPNGASANYVVNFYPQLNGTAVAFSPSGVLAANGSTEVLVGGLSGGFVGSGVISADQNVVAVMAQIPSGNYNRMIASAFSGADGSSKLNLATFLVNQFSRLSTFAVQNVESVSVKIRAQFIDSTGALIADPQVNIPANASKIFEAKTPSTIAAGFPSSFNGSVVVTATIGTTAADAKVVGIAQEVSTGGPNPNTAYAFEAIPQAAASSSVYMPTALCKLGGNVVTTNFAVQNVGTGATGFSVSYRPSGGGSPVVVSHPTLINPGQKAAFNPCADAAGGAVDAAFDGSALITTGGQNVIIIGKAQSTLASGFVTAYIGQATGAAKLSFPYVRYSNTAGNLRTFLSAQNIGGGTITSMTYKFYNGSTGALVSTCTYTNVTAGSKTSTNANDTSGSCSAPTSSFVGSVIVEAPGGSSLIGIARNTLYNAGFSASEDHNAIFLP